MPVTYINIPREVEVYFTNHDEMNDQGYPFIDNLPDILSKHLRFDELIEKWVYDENPDSWNNSTVLNYVDCIVYEPATGWHKPMDERELHDFFTRKV